MPRDAQPTTKAILAVIELDGYRVGAGRQTCLRAENLRDLALRGYES